MFNIYSFPFPHAKAARAKFSLPSSTGQSMDSSPLYLPLQRLVTGRGIQLQLLPFRLVF